MPTERSRLQRKLGPNRLALGAFQVDFADSIQVGRSTHSSDERLRREAFQHGPSALF